jgi:hypothetical protein
VGVKGVIRCDARVERRSRWVRVMPFRRALSGPEAAAAKDSGSVEVKTCVSSSDDELDVLLLVPELVPELVPVLVSELVPDEVLELVRSAPAEVDAAALLSAISRVSTTGRRSPENSKGSLVCGGV